MWTSQERSKTSWRLICSCEAHVQIPVAPHEPLITFGCYRSDVCVITLTPHSTEDYRLPGIIFTAAVQE